METKKISFGFMKTKKQEKPGIVEKREYIDCVEEKSIKVIGGEAVKDESPLVIPMKPNTLVTAERLKQIAEKVESALEEPEPVKKEEPVEEVPPENETLEQMATRELLQEAKKEKVVEQPMLLVPLPAKPVMDGEKESTLDDYESVPIQEFGLAMLRGMGWKPGQEPSKYKQPQLRPKGLGLGADKVVKENQKKNNSKDKEEELAIVKGSYVKVTAGKYNGYYGKVVSLDEDNGRVMIEIAVKKETVSLSEFMMQAVTKSEFDKQSKVINADSYAEYKKNENDSQKISNQENSKSRESVSSHKSNDVSKRDRERREYKEEEKSRETRDSDKYSNGRNKDKEDRLKSHRSRNNSSSDENESHRNKHKDKKRYSSNESLSTDSEKKYRGRKKRHSSTSSNTSSEEEYRRRHKSKSSKNSKEKRDIDKKRKGKKKKRDRDRSPNYRKHKKK